MSNLYSSTIRRFWTSPLASTTFAGAKPIPAIAPPALYTIPIAGFQSQLLIMDQHRINPGSNIIIHNMGLFSNFADGFVVATSAQRIPAQIICQGFGLSSVLGLASMVSGTNVITSAGLFGGIGVGNILLLNKPIPVPPAQNAVSFNQLLQVSSIAGAPNSLTTFGTIQYSQVNATVSKLVPVGALSLTPVEIGMALNSMAPVEIYLNPNQQYDVNAAPPAPLLPGTTQFAAIGISVSLNNTNAIDFYTDSINPAFGTNGHNNVDFTVALDIEFTSQ